MTSFSDDPHVAVYAGLLALAVAIALMPVVILAARRFGWVDDPGEERRVHQRATPLLGGVGILLALLAGTLVFGNFGVRGWERAAQLDQFWWTLACAAAACALGVWDDIADIGWRPKLTGQILVSIGVLFGPLAIGSHTHAVSQLTLLVQRFDPPILPAFHVPVWVAAPLAVFWIVAMMNMVNFIDGVDGLAGGICAISSATFAIVAASYHRIDVAILAASACGATIGFLCFNFRRRARIFMGDSGSLLLGFLLAVISIEGVLKTAAAVSLVIPFALLAIPIFDTAFVVFKRLKYNLPVSHADRWHLHHRLLNVGFSPRRVAVSFWIWSASMSLLALGMRYIKYGKSGHLQMRGLAELAVLAAFAVGMSIYLLVKLEIVKVRSVRYRNARIAAEAAADERRRDSLRP